MKQLRSKKEYALVPLFEKFIADSKSGRRLQPNGKRISAGTVRNYVHALKLLKEFMAHRGSFIRIRDERSLTSREMIRERNYWKKFYRQFTDHLYYDLGFFDNHTGSIIKMIKAFFNYLNKDTRVRAGNFHKQFYVRKEEIGIFPLMPEELNFLIYDQAFSNQLSKRMKEVKDMFVFGCTVALRVSDLISLKKSAVRQANNQFYLAVKSQKTNTETLVRLPDYCIEIIQRYKRNKRALLPSFNKSNLNKYIKRLLEQAGFTQEVSVIREKRGRAITLKNKNQDNRVFRFCDIASTHTMRRTAITTMLCLGMPEQVVRKISGHAPGSKEFYRYVQWSQIYQDQEAGKMFEMHKGKIMERNVV